MTITPFYNAQIARVGLIRDGQTPDISSFGTSPLADQYGRFIVLVDDFFPRRMGSTFGFVSEGQIQHPGMKAVTRVWGMSSYNAPSFFQVRLVNTTTGDGAIVVSIPVAANYGTFAQDMYLDFRLDDVLYDTMYFNLSLTPDTVGPLPGPSLWLNYTYLGAPIETP